MIIDLHGLTSEEALRKVMSGILTFQFSNDMELIIITGKGNGILRMTVLEYLEKENIEYDSKDEARIILYKEYQEEIENESFESLMEQIKKGK